jgi:hypothetical protein
MEKYKSPSPAQRNVNCETTARTIDEIVEDGTEREDLEYSIRCHAVDLERSHENNSVRLSVTHIEHMLIAIVELKKSPQGLTRLLDVVVRALIPILDYVERCPDEELGLKCVDICMILAANGECAMAMVDGGIFRIARIWLSDFVELQSAQGFEFRARLVQLLIVLHQNEAIKPLFQNFDVSLVTRQLRLQKVQHALNVSVFEFLRAFSEHPLGNETWPLYADALLQGISARDEFLNQYIASLLWALICNRTLPREYFLTDEVLHFVGANLFAFPADLLRFFAHAIAIDPNIYRVLDVPAPEILNFMSRGDTELSVPIYALHHMVRQGLVSAADSCFLPVPEMILRDQTNRSFGTRRTELGFLLELVNGNCEGVFATVPFDEVCVAVWEVIEGNDFDWCVTYAISPLMVMLQYANVHQIDRIGLWKCFERIRDIMEDTEEDKQLISGFLAKLEDKSLW